MNKTAFGGLLLVAALGLGGCASHPPKDRIDYRQATKLPDLDVPPDLTRPQTDSSMNVPKLPGHEAPRPVLPPVKGARMMGDGALRWLEVDVPPEKLWPRLETFWRTVIHLDLQVNDPKDGIMETIWGENLSDIPESSFRDFVKPLIPRLYTAPTRDLYRLRVERGTTPGTSELYLSHYGMLKQAVSGGIDTENSAIKWLPRPEDPELENVIYVKLLHFLGNEKSAAKQTVAATPEEITPRAQFDTNSATPALIIDDGFARAWRLAGIALDRSGLVVDDRDRSGGVYYVTDHHNMLSAPEAKPGVFGRLFSSNTDKATRLKVMLTEVGEKTRVQVSGLDSDISADQAKYFLGHLLDALK